MPNNVKITSTMAESLLQYALADGYSVGGENSYFPKTIGFYNGTKPTDADTAITTQTLLARITHTNNAYNGTTTINADSVELRYRNDLEPGTYEHLADGTVTWFRVYSEEGFALFDGTVDTSNADLVLDSTSITAEDEIRLTKFDVVMPLA